MRKHGWAATSLGSLGLGGLVLLLAACGPSSTAPGSAYGASSSSPTASPMSTGSAGGSTSGMGTSGTVTLTIKKTAIGDVLADAKGDTLYWYAKDMKGGPSTCTGSCLAAWPAVTGKPAAAMGVTFAGKLGSVTTTNGTVQATYNGYPLYRYAEDMAPGQTSGNGAGGVWHVVTGQYLTSMSASSGSGSMGSSGSGSSGYPATATALPYLSTSTSTSTSTSSSTGSSTSKNSTSSGGSGSMGSSGSGSSGSGSTGNTTSKNNPAPAPSPTSSINGGGCGSGSCW